MRHPPQLSSYTRSEHSSDGEGRLHAEHARLAELLGEPHADGETSVQRVGRLNRALAARIRAGAYDEPGSTREAVRRHLLESTVDKLRESNPRLLAAEGLE